MKNKRFIRIAAIALALVLALAAFSSCGVASVLEQLFRGRMTEEAKAEYILNKVFEYIQDKYVEELTDEELDKIIEQGANAMLGYYDDYGFLLNPEQYHDVMYPTSTDAGGQYYGFTFTYERYLGLFIHSVVTDSKAYGKVLVGDIITDVKNPDGTPIKYTDTDGAQKILNLKASDLDTVSEVLAKKSRVLATVTRGGTYENAYEDGEEFQVELSKGPIDVSYAKGFEYVEYYFGESDNNLSPTTITLRELGRLNGTDIGYIRISGFSASYDENDFVITDTQSEVKEALELMRQSGKTKLILDLKGNPGGSVDQVTQVAGYFIYDPDKTGDLLVTTMKDRGKSVEYKVKSVYADYFGTDSLGERITVVTDGGSASASELLLGAILDYGTGTHVGTTSYGKGIAQYIEWILPASFVRNGKSIESFYGIYYTAAYYYAPKGGNIHKVGYTPSAENIAPGYAEILQRAKQILD